MAVEKNLERNGRDETVNIPPPMVTREHGAWAVLIVPMIVGVAYAREGSWNVLLLALSALGMFMSYVPVHMILREYSGSFWANEKLTAAYIWAAIFLGIGISFIVPLILLEFWYLLPIGVVGMACFFGNYLLTTANGKTIASDLVAIVGLTLSAPSAYYVSTGDLDMNALVLWILNVLFFGCSVFYVHMKIRVTGMKKTSWKLKEKFIVGALNILYHFFVIGIVFIIVLYHATPVMVILAFVPMVIHAIAGTVTLHRKVRFKKLGFLLLAQSIVFCIILIVSLNI